MLLSGLIRTYNEQLNLPKSLDNLFHFCDEVVISDGGSTDSTRSIAEAYQKSGHNITWLDFPGGSVSDKVHFNHAGKQFEFGYQHCKGDWVMTNDVDIIHCDRLRADLRTILSETDHDAFTMYGVHVIEDWAHYAAGLVKGPGLIQIWRRKPGVHFPDRAEHVGTIDPYPWKNLGVLMGGVYHWGYLDKEEAEAKIRLRHAAMPEDTTYKAVAENPRVWESALIPWDRCHANCETCWMEPTAGGMVIASSMQVAQVAMVLRTSRQYLADAKTNRDKALEDLQEAREDRDEDENLIETLTEKIAYNEDLIEALPKRIAEIETDFFVTKQRADAIAKRAEEMRKA